jgi:MFS family permease
VFYALFGIPLGKLADRWTRTRLLAIGLAVWSAMTALSGLSRNFTQLGLARIGVGVGEASAGPSAYSLLSDYFRRGCRRDRDLFAGIYLGGGVSLFIGSSIANGWNSASLRARIRSDWPDGRSHSWPWACPACCWRDGSTACASRRAAATIRRRTAARRRKALLQGVPGPWRSCRPSR